MGIDGIDEATLVPWLAEHVAALRPPLSFTLIAGGRSNLTFRVDDADGRAFVLRRPPLKQVLATAHDMGREHRIIAALAPTAVPVAPALAYCDDESVNGAPFYVMAFVEGHILRDSAAVEAELPVPLRRAAGESLVDVLAAIHDVDPDAVGLGELGRKEGYVTRQLKRWHTQLQSATTTPPPLLDELHARLAATVPEQVGSSIVHGDYRLDNCVVGHDGEVRAVLDWELCTLGDPLADLGILLAYWSEPADGVTEDALVGAPTRAPGFPTRSEVVARYADRTGRDLSVIDFYVAFANWKLACILQGVADRYRGGAMGDDGTDAEAFTDRIERSAQTAAKLLAGM